MTLTLYSGRGVGGVDAGGFARWFLEAPFFVGPVRIAVDGESFSDASFLIFSSLLRRWYDGSPARQGPDGGKLVLEWGVGGEMDVLVGVGGLPVDVKGESAVIMPLDGDI